MTTSLGSDSPQKTYPLSPFQRAALAYRARLIRLTVEAPRTPTALVESAANVLRASPELTASLAPAPSSLLPRQAPHAITLTPRPTGEVHLAAGALSLTAKPAAIGAILTIEADALVADAVSLELLCERIAAGGGVEAPVSFFDIAADHAAMLQEGELDQEKAYWQDLRRESNARAALGCDRSWETLAVAASVPIDFTSIEAQASALDADPADILHLSLHLLLDRVSPDGTMTGRIVDARELMGLTGRSGLFTQVTPHVTDIDAEAPVRLLLEQHVARRRRHAEMAGAPAFTEQHMPPTVVFDPRLRWRLPDGWRLIETFEARQSGLFLRCACDGDEASLVANACDGANAAGLLVVLTAWKDVVSALIREPHTPWKSLPLGGDGMNVESPVYGNRAAAEDLCARVRQLVDADQDASAVRQGTQALTRRALVHRIGDFADALGPLEPGAVVGVLSGHEPDLLAAWLAILWRGAAFLPLLLTEPRQRLERAISESQMSALIVGDGAPALDVPARCRVIAGRDVAAKGLDPGPPAPVDDQQLACVLRTSGSSGVPKLVAVRRESLNNYLRAITEDVLKNDGELPVVSSPIFDASFKQLLGPQYSGRSTWLLAADPADPLKAFAELAAVGAPLIINCTPTYWAELLEIGASAARRLTLRRLLLGGESIGDALRQRTIDQYPEAEIWNLYGPTEATANATAGVLAPGEPTHVGTPIAGAIITIADRYGRPLARGLRGEVWISGSGLANGYIGAVDQGAFGTLRLGGVAVRAYRTGDVGSIDGDGRLRLYGRLDAQLKLRGWRIEPEEIERVAETAPGVITAKVILDTRDDAHQLRLFVLGNAEEASLLKALRERLPSPMIPATVTCVDRLPLTETGKLDHRALLAAVSTGSEASPSDYKPLQLEIATIWRDLVGHGWPRVDDDFFSAGGHSLLLARLVNQLRARGHSNISLSQVVRHPTINTMAAIIGSAGVDA
jgi:non-ribosomal peptide synthetase component F/aryl carrier-like protein